MDGRTSKQCRERWCHHLDPAVRKGGYTTEEDELIIFLQVSVGERGLALCLFVCFLSSGLRGRRGSFVRTTPFSCAKTTGSCWLVQRTYRVPRNDFSLICPDPTSVFRR